MEPLAIASPPTRPRTSLYQEHSRTYVLNRRASSDPFLSDIFLARDGGTLRGRSILQPPAQDFLPHADLRPKPFSEKPRAQSELELDHENNGIFKVLPRPEPHVQADNPETLPVQLAISQAESAAAYLAEEEFQSYIKSLDDITTKRLGVQEKRVEFKMARSAVSDADRKLMDRLRQLEANEAFVISPSLKALYEDCETARGQVGPLELEYETMENSLNRVEFAASRKYQELRNKIIIREEDVEPLTASRRSLSESVYSYETAPPIEIDKNTGVRTLYGFELGNTAHAGEYYVEATYGNEEDFHTGTGNSSERPSPMHGHESIVSASGDRVISDLAMEDEETFSNEAVRSEPTSPVSNRRSIALTSNGEALPEPVEKNIPTAAEAMGSETVLPDTAFPHYSLPFDGEYDSTAVDLQSDAFTNPDGYDNTSLGRRVGKDSLPELEPETVLPFTAFSHYSLPSDSEFDSTFDGLQFDAFAIPDVFDYASFGRRVGKDSLLEHNGNFQDFVDLTSSIESYLHKRDPIHRWVLQEMITFWDIYKILRDGRNTVEMANSLWFPLAADLLAEHEPSRQSKYNFNSFPRRNDSNEAVASDSIAAASMDLTRPETYHFRDNAQNRQSGLHQSWQAQESERSSDELYNYPWASRHVSFSSADVRAAELQGSQSEQHQSTNFVPDPPSLAFGWTGRHPDTHRSWQPEWRGFAHSLCCVIEAH